jgi:N-acetylglutamate synthase-like GNAT family acetyltransferase
MIFRQATEEEFLKKSREFFGDERTLHSGIVAFVLEEGGQVKAFGGFVPEGNIAAFTSFAVPEDLRGNGHARLFLDHLIAEAKARGFELARAITHLWEPLVEKAGFHLTGRNVQELLRGTYVEKLPHFEEMRETEKRLA